MRVAAFLTYMARLKRIDDGGLPERIRRALERVGLEDTARKRCEELSKGMLQKVQFLAAIIHEPELLILDEPFSGLDPISMRLLRDLILEEHDRGATILFSTHVMPQAEEICRHVVMIHRGRKVLDESIAAIRRQYDPRTILIEPLNPEADAASLGALAEVERVVRADGGYEVMLVAGVRPQDAIRGIAAAMEVARIELSRPRLEDVFVKLVSSDGLAAGTERALRADLRGVAPRAASAGSRQEPVGI